MENLALTQSERSRMEGAVQAAVVGLQKLEQSKMVQVSSAPNQQVYLIPAFPAEGKAVLAGLQQAAGNILGPDRAAGVSSLLEKQLSATSGDFGVLPRTITVESGPNGQVTVRENTVSDHGERSMSQTSSGGIPSRYRHLFDSSP